VLCLTSHSALTFYILHIDRSPIVKRWTDCEPLIYVQIKAVVIAATSKTVNVQGVQRRPIVCIVDCPGLRHE
jgi:hypothetical protein